MRTGCDFIEVTHINTGKKYMINTAAILYILEPDHGEHATIIMNNGDRSQRVITKESYEEVSAAIFGPK